MNPCPAKLLLFGEHTILRGSRALAVPYYALGGQWAWGASAAQQQRLPELARYLAANWPTELIDSRQLAQDLQAGLFFDSNIPLGYGLGSSGALCAAVFARYASPEALTMTQSALKDTLARIESFFHGASSGIDPLLCYLQKPLCLMPDGSFEELALPALDQVQFFLLDTGIARSTGPLVRYFTQRFDDDPHFRAQVQTHWIAGTEAAIDACIQAHAPQLWSAFDLISRFQRQHLPPMIPAAVEGLWDEGAASDHFRLKLCGAGGGGFMLGLSTNRPATEAALSGQQLHWV